MNPDVSRQIPVPSLATGRIVEIDARLGDEVKKGQLLFKVRSMDIAGAYSDYRQAVKNEQLTKMQLDRAKLLFDQRSDSKSSVEIAQTNEDDNRCRRRNHAKSIFSSSASTPPIPPASSKSSRRPPEPSPTSKSRINPACTALALPAPFTISDTSHVWIVCDVWENDMSQVHIGEYADIHLAAYPDRVLKARISNILPAVDPNIRTEKVRLEVENPGMMRLGMFVTATFHGETLEHRATVPVQRNPASA